MLLTDAEKITFINWLHIEAETNDILVEQMKKINVPQVAMDKLKMEAAACRIVANLLGDGEKVTI